MGIAALRPRGDLNLRLSISDGVPEVVEVALAPESQRIIAFPTQIQSALGARQLASPCRVDRRICDRRVGPSEPPEKMVERRAIDRRLIAPRRRERHRVPVTANAFDEEWMELHPRNYGSDEDARGHALADAGTWAIDWSLVGLTFGELSELGTAPRVGPRAFRPLELGCTRSCPRDVTSRGLHRGHSGRRRGG
jgi:hypothetical protein